MKLKEALDSGAELLRKHQLPHPRRDTEILAAAALGRDLSFLLAHPEYELDVREQELLERWLCRRARHYPIQYLRGVQEFYGRNFLVTPAVLIPRPETELLVEVCLEISRGNLPARVLDIGTGSGCIALTLLCEEPQFEIVASDISEAALEVAKENWRRLGCSGHIRFVWGDLAEAVIEKREAFHLIVSNPPYAAIQSAKDMDPAVGYEPREAVFGGNTGFEFYERLFSEVGPLLENQGKLVLELGFDQADEIRQRAHLHGWRLLDLRHDLAGIERCAVFQRRLPISRIQKS